jgi:hypothetical protein
MSGDGRRRPEVVCFAFTQCPGDGGLRAGHCSERRIAARVAGRRYRLLDDGAPSADTGIASGKLTVE